MLFGYKATAWKYQHLGTKSVFPLFRIGVLSERFHVGEAGAGAARAFGNLSTLIQGASQSRFVILGGFLGKAGQSRAGQGRAS
jgi:hypothetical protein